jgi:hypothetical protein
LIALATVASIQTLAEPTNAFMAFFGDLIPLLNEAETILLTSRTFRQAGDREASGSWSGKQDDGD